MTRTATCACGQLRVTAEREPERVLACNCRECQRRTGSVFGVSAYFAAAAVGIEGTSRSFKRTGRRARFRDALLPGMRVVGALDLERHAGSRRGRGRLLRR